jgi:hypothetical protein
MRLGARARVCVHALRACCVGKAPGQLYMRRVRVWGQRHFVPRSYPGHTKSPLCTGTTRSRRVAEQQPPLPRARPTAHARAGDVWLCSHRLAPRACATSSPVSVLQRFSATRPSAFLRPLRQVHLRIGDNPASNSKSLLPSVQKSSELGSYAKFSPTVFAMSVANSANSGTKRQCFLQVESNTSAVWQGWTSCCRGWLVLPWLARAAVVGPPSTVGIPGSNGANGIRRWSNETRAVYSHGSRLI